MKQVEKMKAQAAALQAKMGAKVAKQKMKLEALQERIRLAEERDAAFQTYWQAQMIEEVKVVIQRYQRRGLRAHFQLVKEAFLEPEKLAEAGLKAAPVLVEAKAEAVAAAAPKPKTEWQKWVFDHVKPLWMDSANCDSNLFNIARRLRDSGDMARVLYEGGVLERITVAAEIEKVRAERDAAFDAALCPDK